METFEIHITADKNILQRTDVKTIAVDLLKPDKTLLRTEFMTSIVKKFPNYQECLNWTLNLTKSIENVIRVKIESPFYPHYVENSLYMESHFITESNKFPLSQNQRKTTFLGTDRTYQKELYDSFAEEWKNSEVELCLYDSFVDEDKDWFKLYA